MHLNIKHMRKLNFVLIGLFIFILNNNAQRNIRADKIEFDTHLRHGDSIVTHIYGDTLINKQYVDELSSSTNYNRDSVYQYELDSNLVRRNDTIAYADTALYISPDTLNKQIYQYEIDSGLARLSDLDTLNSFDSIDVNYIDHNDQSLFPPYRAGRKFYYNPFGSTVSYLRDSVWSIDGQFITVFGRNITNDTLRKGKVIMIDSCSTCFYPAFRLAVASSRLDVETVAGVVMRNIPPDSLGYILNFGGLDTDASAYDAGTALYLSPVDSGELVSYAPRSPFYKVRIAKVETPGVNGLLGIGVEPFVGNDTEVALDGILNGIITDKQSIRDTIISNVLYFETNNETQDTIDLPFIYQNNCNLLNTTSGAGKDGRAQVALTYGTSTNAQTNYIYIDYNGGSPLLAANTTGFPTDGIRLAECSVWDQSTHEIYGFASFQRYNNSVNGSTTNGWISRSAKRHRLDGSRWESGVTPTVTIITDATVLDTLNVSTTSGITYQFNEQVFPAQPDTGYLWLNSPTGERWITHLGEIDSTAAGIYLHGGVNRRYRLNLFIIQKSGDYGGYIAVNAPTDYYSTDQAAINDDDNTSITTVPPKYGKTAMRLLVLVINYSTASNGTLTNLLGAGAYQDERGQLLGIGGGGGGSVGISYPQSDAAWSLSNSADPTKLMDFDLVNIPSGTTGTITAAPGDIDLGNIAANYIDLSTVSDNALLFELNDTIGSSSNLTWNDTVLNILSVDGQNVFIGQGAGNSRESGGNINTALGLNALYSSTTGVGNVSLGQNADYLNVLGSRNTSVGTTARSYSVAGDSNVCVGYQSGQNNSGSRNVFIGSGSGRHETGSHKLYIANSQTSSPLIYGEFDNQLIDINGRLAIDSSLAIYGSTGDSIKIQTDTAYFDSTVIKPKGIKFPDGTYQTTATGGSVDYDVTRTIYVTTTGDDNTGDGSIGTPFLTLQRALQDVKNYINVDEIITIDISGGINVNTELCEKEFARITRLDGSKITIQGSMAQVASGFTLTARNPEAYIYESSGSSFTNNQHQDNFLLDGSEYHPIPKNEGDTLYALPGASPATSIYQINDTLKLSSGLFNVGSPYTEGGTQTIEFKHLNINYAGNIIGQWSGQVNFMECSFNTVGLQLEYRTKVVWEFERCVFITTGTSYGIQYKSTPGCSFKECVLRKSGATGGSGLEMPTLSTSTINGVYIYNYDEGFSQSGGTTVFEFNKSNIVLDSCTTGFILENGSHMSMYRKSVDIYLDDVDYLLGQRNTSNDMIGNYSFHVYDIIGTPNTDYLDANLTVNGYIDWSRDISIIIPGVTPLGTGKTDIIETRDSLELTIQDDVVIDSTLKVGAGSDTSSVFYTSVYSEIDTLATSGAITIDCNKSNVFVCYQTGNITALDVENMQPGGTYIAYFYQGVTGGYSITLSLTPTDYEASSNEDFSTTADDVNVFQFTSDGTNIHYSNSVFTKQ